MNFLKFKIMSLLVLGFVGVQASEGALGNEVVCHTKPIVTYHIHKNYLKMNVSKSFWPEHGTRNADGYDFNELTFKSHAFLMEAMVKRICFYTQDKENLLREITNRTAKSLDLHLESSMISGSKEYQQTAKLYIVPADDIDLTLFQSRVMSNVPKRFKDCEFDIAIEFIGSQEDIQP